jgi:hypothetical protein
MAPKILTVNPRRVQNASGSFVLMIPKGVLTVGTRYRFPQLRNGRMTVRRSFTIRQSINLSVGLTLSARKVHETKSVNKWGGAEREEGSNSRHDYRTHPSHGTTEHLVPF